MRGKKSDSEFVSEFISQCVTSGVDTPDLIVNYAKNIICGIDEEIKRIEKKKLYRSKVLDVINTFEKSENKSKLEEAKILSFYKLSYPSICKRLCEQLKFGPVIANFDIQIDNLDILFCIKQMIEYKIASKAGEYLVRGDKFEEYLKFLLKDK